jgi:hypothetical protein
VEATQQRCFNNCVYNEIHSTNRLDYTPQIETEFETAPRNQRTLMIFGEDKPVHLCMYGANNPATWEGNTCDVYDDKSKHCPMFQPRVNIEQARNEFIGKLSDDEYVFNNFRDVATLQWVLGERVHDVPLTLFERFWFWFKAKLWKPVPALPPLPLSDLPAELWYGPNDPPPSS